jgi:hypothetical protein
MCPYPKGGMFEGVSNVVLRVHPTSHLFSCRMDSLNVLGQ